MGIHTGPDSRGPEFRQLADPPQGTAAGADFCPYHYQPDRIGRMSRGRQDNGWRPARKDRRERQ